MVRISRIGDRWVATGVRLAGWGDDRNLTEIDRHERVLAEEESRQMLQAVDAFGLWNRQDTSYPEYHHRL
jgi:vacuolar-type H+-ATPase subunit F/Vma7